MTPVPPDIFTEPADVDPDTLANLGPLTRLAGTWEAEGGVDVSPKAAGPEQRDYIERIECLPIDPQANGPQLLYGLRYHVHITTREEDITFHDQTGYWLWEPATGLVMQSLAIPRGQVALASGHAQPGDVRLVLEAVRGGPGYGICSTDFLEAAFRTLSYRIELEFEGEDAWRYELNTILQVHGQAEPFVHQDRNRLVRIGAAVPNPMMQMRVLRAEPVNLA